MSGFTEEDLDSVDTFFAADKIQAEKERREEARKHIQDMQNVLATESGRRVVFWYTGLANLFDTGYNGRAIDMGYAMGRQSVCKEALRLAMYADPRILAKFVEDNLLKTEG